MAGLGQWIRDLFATSELAPAADGRTRPFLDASDPRAFAAANNAFALDLYARLRTVPGNLFLSPFSIRTALAMVCAGSGGETAREMAAVLRLPAPDETLHRAFGAMVARLSAGGGGRYELAVANSLWAQEGSPMRTEFAELCARWYGGGLFGVDFARAAEAARATINRWVEERTRERIADLIPQGGVTELTRLVLANAVYFKGAWSAPFDERQTRHEPFYRATGGAVSAPLMHQEGGLEYAHVPHVQVVNLPYRGDDLSMAVLLPNRRNGLARLERRLSPRLFDDCLGGLMRREVRVWLPRFTVTWGTHDVGAALGEMGMPTAFDPARADFSGITGPVGSRDDALSIGPVLHKAFVDTTEEGTEAAAATAVTLCVGAAPGHRPPPVPVFRADHPFLFAIIERASGAILFLGRVADPTRER